MEWNVEWNIEWSMECTYYTCERLIMRPRPLYGHALNLYIHYHFLDQAAHGMIKIVTVSSSSDSLRNLMVVV